MSDEGEKTCPLCAEEMDLTDQQLKPCRCGYEICVWCWHHIMDMAEKDETEGRCPACRSPYDKEKIVGMTAKCESLVAETSMDRKTKIPKSKTRTSEGKKQQLSTVRVVQRNLVYIVGLPLNLGDEDLLQRREYFGQYGKVLKVSMSRTSAGVIQQFQNNTCSVYITYSKEDEAIRCIQSVHGFVLEGRTLKACYGTTKYCHAWLRNVPCTNPDCLYLHEVGSQEDSFTKDEAISPNTRNKVQQITGTTNSLQPRSGSVLPPSLDDYCHGSSASTAKPPAKNSLNNIANFSEEPTPNGISARSAALPAAASWGVRVSNQQPVATSSWANGPLKQKLDTVGSAVAFSSAVANTTSVSTLHVDVVEKTTVQEDSQITLSQSKSDVSKPSRQHFGADIPSTPNEEPASVSLSNQASCPPLSIYSDKGLNMPPNLKNSLDTSRHTGVSGPEKEENITADVKMLDLCSDLSAMSMDRNAISEHSGLVRASSALLDNGMMKSPGNQGPQEYNADQSRESLLSSGRGKAIASKNDVSGSREPFGWKINSLIQAGEDASPQEEEDVFSFDSQRLKDPEVVCNSTYMPKSANSFHISNHSESNTFQCSDAFTAMNLNSDTQFVDNNVTDSSRVHLSSMVSNGYPEKLSRSSSGTGSPLENAFLLSNVSQGRSRTRLHANADVDAALDAGENSIISNILSMDFDSWDDPLSFPQSLAKLLSEPEKDQSSAKVPSSSKGHSHSQSRFSFARQDESRNKPFDIEQSFSGFSQQPMSQSLNQDFFGSRDPLLEKLVMRNGFHPSHCEEFSPNKFSAARSQISAPPGFSVPNRAPPPGFTSHERVDQSFDTMFGNRLHDSTSMMRNTYQTQSVGNVGSTGDIEFMDPAILAVGKGRLQNGLNNPGLDMRNNFPQQLNAFENEARLQLMMERSLSSQQNLRYANIGDSFCSHNDSYGISSRLMDQPQGNNISPFAQLSMQQSRNPLVANGGHWDRWNEVQSGSNLGMADLLRNERLAGFTKFYNGYEDPKFHMPSSGDLYNNRTFGM